MSRKRIRRIAALLAAACGAAAEEKISSVRVFGDAPDVVLTVDGAPVRQSGIFLWPQWSKHTLIAPPYQENVRPNTLYTFTRWLDPVTSGPIPGGNAVTVTADPRMSYFKAEYAVAYALRLNFGNCGGEAPCVSPAGEIYINGALVTANTLMWVNAGTTVTLQATPKPGYLFAGWNSTAGSGWTASSVQLTMDAPHILSPRFLPSRRIRIETCAWCDGSQPEPEGLQVLIDRAPRYTPAEADWGWETVHSLAVPTPQFDLYGRQWAFAGWIDGAPAVRAYKVPPGSMLETVVARFVPAARVTLMTSPPGLKLAIDGRENWESYNFGWGVGETHRLAAPLEQKDAQGRTYVFKAWSDGLAAAHDLVITEQHLSGLRVVAEYEMLGRLTVTSSPPALALSVNGEECRTPCVLDRAAGAQVRVSAPARIDLYDGAALFLDGWADAAEASRAYTFTGAARTLHASYRLRHRLTLTSDPAGQASFRVEPGTADGFFATDANVQVTVEPAAGYRFRRWEGHAGGMYRSTWVQMSAPRWANAALDAVPYVAPSGVKNAAADLPDAGVAAGSVISLIGLNLTARAESGPSSPMAQTLAGVAVRMGARLLPLVFASPEQINLQLPYDTEPGRQTLTILSEGHAPLEIPVEVVRNAPGLFHHMVDGRAMAVTAGAPARPGESVTLLGTGFGPYDRQPVAGFAIPAGAVYRLQDPVEIFVGEESVRTESAGAAEGMAGVDAIRFRVPAGASGPITVKTRVNGRESNAVIVPVAM